MNKLDFLRRLDKELSVLDKEERKEILGFYEERFYSGTIYENKTEAEVIAELEKPEEIAKNVLEEYGVSPKFVKVKEERYSNVSVSKAILLITFDVLFATSILSSLYVFALAIIGSSFTWFATIGLMLGERTAVDEYTFAFITGAYILLFFFGLVVLDAALWVTKTLIKWHLNVFKVKNRDKTFKKLSHLSLDAWFKKHRRTKRIKNLSLVAAIVAITISGFWIFNHFDWVQAEYGNGEIISDIVTEDFEAEISNMDVWSIQTDLENLDIEVVLVSGDDISIKHTYYQKDEFVYLFDYDNNVISITNNPQDKLQFFWNPSDLFQIFSKEVEVRIEFPSDLILDAMDLSTTNARVSVVNVDSNTLDIDTSNATVSVSNNVFLGNVNINTSNSKIDFSNNEVRDDVTLKTTNGKIYVNNIEVIGTSTLLVDTSNNGVYISNVNFSVYNIDTSNGPVKLQDLNNSANEGLKLVVDTSNNSVELENVYINDITVKTTNGDIDYTNSDVSYHPNNLDLNTSNYQYINTIVTED